MTHAVATLPRLAGVTWVHDADREWVERAKAGDAAAFSELVRRHQPVVYNLAYRFMRDAALAEDMTQDAFLKAFRHIRKFRSQATFGTWMYRVACNVCLTELNRRKRRGETAFDRAHDRAAPTVPPGSDDEHEVVRRCVTKLSPRYAMVVTLYYLDQVSYEEIAQIMGVPLGTLKTWLHRARNELKKIVQQELGK